MTGRRTPLLPLALTCTTAVAAAQAPTFSTRLDVVRVDVLVTDRNRVVRGLGPADFEIRDNDVLQQVDLVSFEALPLNVILALDASASVSGERLEHLRDAGRTLLDRLARADRAALLTFSHLVALRQDLTTQVERVRAALDAVEPSGGTALADGTYAALTLAEEDAGRDLLIVFSDGVDTSSWLTADRVLGAVRRADLVISGVWVRGTGEPDFLRAATALSGGTLLEAESSRDLGALFVRILDEFRQRYVVSYSPRGVPSDGWHRLDVRVRGRRASVRARAGYQGGS